MEPIEEVEYQRKRHEEENEIDHVLSRS
jgi:hypothetical protein